MILIDYMSDIRFYGYKHWTLEDPPRCFNVGKGLKGRAHAKCPRGHKWIHTAKRLGLRVEECIGPVTDEVVKAWERANIKLMGTRSFNPAHNNDADIGCNFTDGGDGTSGHKHTADTRVKMSAARKGDGNSFFGKKHTVETCAKMSKTRKGRKLSLEHCAKLSIVRKGRKHTDETRAKLKGRIVTNETRAKLSAAIKGRPKSHEACEKMSESAKRRPPISEETRAKKSLAQKRRHARQRQLAGVK